MVVSERCHEGAGIRTRQVLEFKSGILDTLKYNLEQIPLLRIHILCFGIRDAKELVAEGMYVVRDEITAPSFVGWKEAINVEPRARYFAVSRAPVFQEFPEFVCISDIAW